MIQNNSIQLRAMPNRKFNYNNWLYHEDRVDRVLDGDFYSVKPVTVQLSPSLSCTHRCYFCSYGKTKKDLAGYPQFMEWDLMQRVVDELSKFGVKAITFTGGGDPTTYDRLIDAMEYCKRINPKLDIGLFTNGNLLNKEFIGRFVDLNPLFVRVSLNSGSSAVQRLVAGVDDFEKVIGNIEDLARNKVERQSQLDVSVGFVVNVVNYSDLERLAERLKEMEGVSSFRVRPIVNYENSKIEDSKIREKIIDYFNSRNLDQRYLKAFNSYMNGEQNPSWLRDEADQAAKNVAAILEKSGIELFYAGSKFKDLASSGQRSYPRCLGSSWILAVWPNGDVFPCIEWAGAKDFKIGNLKNESLDEIWTGKRRKDVTDMINSQVLQKRCAPTCVQHELNIILADIETRLKEGKRADVEKEINEHLQIPPPRYVNFI